MLDPNTAALLSQLGVAPASVEAALSGLIWLTVVSIVAAVPTAFVARRKHRSVVGWLIFALSIPVLPLLLVWLLPARKPKPDA